MNVITKRPICVRVNLCCPNLRTMSYFPALISSQYTACDQDGDAPPSIDLILVTGEDGRGYGVHNLIGFVSPRKYSS